MNQLRSAMRIAITIGVICASLAWLAAGLNIVPNPQESIVNGRVDFAKAVAVSITPYAENNRIEPIEQVLEQMVDSNGDLESVAIERRSDAYRFSAGPHAENWRAGSGKSTGQLRVNVFADGRKWGQLELRFRDLSRAQSVFVFPLTFIAFLAAAITLATFLVLSRAFGDVDPANVVPERVRAALDTLAEGLVLLNMNGEIAHANGAFSQIVGNPAEDLVGQSIDVFDWLPGETGEQPMPWHACIESLESVVGHILEYKTSGTIRKYIVNASPINNNGQKCKGILASFEDITALEEKRAELGEMLQIVRKSREEFREQNEKLNFLVSYDPLTECLNRRAFWTQYDSAWEHFAPEQLNVMMIDIDHFKLINDNYGHSVGDDVLRETGVLLKRIVADRGSVCRFGGEEFIVLVQGMPLDDAESIAESIADEFRHSKIGGLDVTVSIGISNRGLGAMDAQHLLDQADQSLYGAKRSGRDRVMRFDQCPAEVLADISQQPGKEPAGDQVRIEYAAVTGLLSALAFRSLETAEHSLRVADLAVAIGSGILNKKLLYNLEIAALLHDIGKIGVPDAILNKPEQLNHHEWTVMAKHDEVGLEIVRAAFSNPHIADIIESHRKPCESMQLDESSLDMVDEDVVSARIISVCDAFDSMVSDRVYRRGRSIGDALSELQNCTPKQFDPEIVRLLSEHVQNYGYEINRRVLEVQSPGAGSRMEHQIKRLCDAIDNEDVELIQITVEGLAGEHLAEENQDASSRGSSTPSGSGGDLAGILPLAEEVLELCRITRERFIDRTADPLGMVDDHAPSH